MADSFTQYAQNNQQALMGFGAGLLGSAPTTGDRFQRGLLGFQQGYQADQERMRLEQERQRVEQERQRRAQIANQVLNQYRPEPSQRGPTRAAAAAGEDRYQRGLLASEAIRQGDIGAATGLLSPSGQEAPGIIRTVQAMGYDPASEAGRNLIRELEGSGGSTQTEREVQRYMRRGYDRATAEDIAFGNIDVETDQFGNTYLVNVATGTRSVLRGDSAPGSVDVGMPQPATSQPEGEDTQSVFDAAEEGVGPMSMTREAINNVIGPFIEGTIFPETTRSRSAIRNFNQTAKQALVNSERFPVYEQQIVEQLLPNPDRFFNDPDAERGKLVELKNFLQRKKTRIQRSMQSGGITTQERGDLSNQVSTIDRIIGLMGPMSQGQGESARRDSEGMQFTRDNPASPTTRQEYDQLPRGAYFVDDEGLKRKP